MPVASKVILRTSSTQTPPPRSGIQDTPPDSPTTPVPNPFEFAQQIIGAVKLILQSGSKDTSPVIEPQVEADAKPRVKASKVEFKVVDEV